MVITSDVLYSLVTAFTTKPNIGIGNNNDNIIQQNIKIPKQENLSYGKIQCEVSFFFCFHFFHFSVFQKSSIDSAPCPK